MLIQEDSVSLINFRCDDKLKKDAFAVLKDLKKLPSDLFKDVLTYVVQNKKLPVENIIMSVNDLNQATQDPKDIFLSSLVNNKKPQNTLSLQSGLIHQKKDAFKIALKAIQDMNTGLIIAEESITTSIAKIDHIIEQSEIHKRDLVILNIGQLKHGVYDSCVCYNPFRGKSSGSILMIALSPFFDTSTTAKYCHQLLNIYNIEMQNIEDLNFENLRQLTASFSPNKNILFKTEDEIEAFNALEKALDKILESNLSKILTPNLDSIHFDLADIIKNQKIGLIQDSIEQLEMPLSDEHSMFYQIFNADLKATFISLENETLEKLTHLIVSPPYISLQFANKAVEYITRKLKINLYLFADYSEFFASPDNSFIVLLHNSHTILLYKPDIDAESMGKKWDADIEARLKKLKDHESLLVLHSGSRVVFK